MKKITSKQLEVYDFLNGMHFTDWGGTDRSDDILGCLAQMSTKGKKVERGKDI